MYACYTERNNFICAQTDATIAPLPTPISGELQHNLWTKGFTDTTGPIEIFPNVFWSGHVWAMPVVNCKITTDC